RRQAMTSSSQDKNQDTPQRTGEGPDRRDVLLSGGLIVAASALPSLAATAQAQQAPAQHQSPPPPPPGARSRRQPNIVFIMGDDIGWFNIGAYHRGMMSGKTPNIDQLASQGMLFTDYYAEASCTAGRAAFITGEIPLRTGLTTVGQAGA